MEINEQGQFVPTPMPKLYFDHDQESLFLALGVTAKRKLQLERAVEDMIEERAEKKNKFKRVSEEIEAILNIAENEQERIVLALNIGAKHSSQLTGGGGIRRMEIDLSDMMGGSSDDVKKAILKMIRDRFKNRDGE